MDISFSSLLALCIGAYIIWDYYRNKTRTAAARQRIKNDKTLYQHIKSGMREYHWKMDKEEDFWDKAFDAKDGDLLFETAHLSAYKVNHFVEYRVGFYFKDLNQYGLYCSFEYFEHYYRTDRSFGKEESLFYDDDDESDDWSE
jgi:hypothetical protein